MPRPPKKLKEDIQKADDFRPTAAAFLGHFHQILGGDSDTGLRALAKLLAGMIQNDQAPVMLRSKALSIYQSMLALVSGQNEQTTSVELMGDEDIDRLLREGLESAGAAESTMGEEAEA